MDSEIETRWPIEAALIGELLSGDPDLIADAAGIVVPAELADERCSLIYETILALDGQGRRVDPIMVCESLKLQGKLATAGGPAFVGALGGSSPFANVKEHARLIHEAATRRALVRVCREVADLSGEPIEVPALLEEAGRKFFAVVEERQVSSIRGAGELLEETLEMLHQLKNGAIEGVGTGLQDVDRLLGGLHGGELYVLAARPGVGKTAFALGMARHLSMTKRLPVLLFSLEMPDKQLMTRVIAAEAGIDNQRLRHGRFSPAEEERMQDAAERIHAAPLFIDDSGDVSPLDIRSKARSMKRKHPTLALIIVDYLQLVKVRGRVESRQTEVAEISRSLKALAKELNIPVLALSQLNRKVEERSGPPRLSDLRESGAIEQDADAVLFLHRDGADDEDDGPAPTAMPVDLHVAKQRNGPVGEVPLTFLCAPARFESRSRR